MSELSITSDGCTTRESRDHAVWEEQGLLTITGGKLTTFLLMALDTLKAIRAEQADIQEVSTHTPVLDAANGNEPGLQFVRETTRRRLLGRYDAHTTSLVARAQIGELESIPGTEMLWAELRWASHTEGAIHLDDLLLRRVRLALVLLREGKRTYPGYA